MEKLNLYTRAINNISKNSVIQENTTFSVEFDKNKSFSIKDMFLFPQINNYGFRNLKFIGDTRQIKNIYLEIGGIVVDVIMPYLTGIMEFSIFENVIPSLKYYEIRIRVEYLTTPNTEIECCVDFCKILNPPKIDDLLVFNYYGKQHHTFNYPLKNENIIMFNHSIKKMIVFSNSDLGEVKCKFNNDEVFKFYKVENGIYEFEFKGMIEFNKIDKVLLCIENINDIKKLVVMANTYQTLTIDNNGVNILYPDVINYCE